jgi:biopolymer transport protein ExbB/TolQ
MSSNTSRVLFEHLIRNGEKEKVNSHSASGGLLGPISLIGFGLLGAFLLYNDFYFLGMMIFALSLTVYSADYQTPRLLHFCVSVLSRNSHITENASMIISANIDADKIERQYYLDRDKELAREMSFSLSNDLVKFLIDESDEDEETLINTFENLIFNDADEAYAYSISTLDTVGNLMPLVGLVGTVVGMIGALGVIRDNPSLDISSIAGSVGVAMQTTLYGALFSVIYKVVAMRFKEKRSALEYDFERLKNHIQLIVKIRQKRTA